MTPSSSSSDLKKKAVKSGVITMCAQVAMVAIQLLSIVILSRLLTPEDFGVIAMITAITVFMGLFRDMGLSTATIQKGILTHEQMTLLFWLNTTAGAVLTLLVIGLAPFIALFYNDSALTNVTALLASTFLISSIGAQHSALMQRQLRFKPKAVADVTGAAVTLILSVLLAYRGFGYWSLAWGTVLGAVTTTALYICLGKFKPGWPKRAPGMRKLIEFGANVTAFEIANYFHRNLDNILIGRFWGAATLGLYSRAYQMMMLPIVSLRTPINAIAFPVLSKLKGQPAEFRKYYCRISSLLALLSMPLMAFLTLNADLVVRIALGPDWEQVTPIFIFLGIAGFVQPVASLRGLVLLSLGKSRRYLIWGLLNTTVVSIAFIVGVQWGGEGVAAAYALANYLILYPSMLFIFHGTPLQVGDFFSSIALPATASILAALACYLVSLAFVVSSLYWQLLISFIVFAFAFAFVYLTTTSGKTNILFYVSLFQSIKN